MDEYGDDFESMSSTDEDEANADLSGASGYSSLSSPDRPAHPLANIEMMLARIRGLRRDTLAAVERLAPHMPELVAMVEGLETEAIRHQQSAWPPLMLPNHTLCITGERSSNSRLGCPQISTGS